MEFINTFKLDAKLLPIINIEFGLNVVLPIELICIKELLLLLAYHDKNQFYSGKKLPFMRYSTTININGSTNEFKIIKAYAKGIQFPTITDINTFRFEVKSNRKNYINSLGIYTLNDLLIPDTYLVLENTILSEFDNVLILDDTQAPKLSKTRLKTHKKRLTNIYWHRLFYKSRNLFRINFNKYYSDLNTCETHLKKEIKKLIFSKLQELKKCAISNPCIDEIRTPFLNTCLVTGLNISMQRDDSILLSHTGLRYYLKTDKKVYQELLQKHLPTKWMGADNEIQLKELAHNIRNIHTNRQRKQIRLYPVEQIKLFTYPPPLGVDSLTIVV